MLPTIILYYGLNAFPHVPFTFPYVSIQHVLAQSQSPTQQDKLFQLFLNNLCSGKDKNRHKFRHQTCILVEKGIISWGNYKGSIHLPGPFLALWPQAGVSGDLSLDSSTRSCCRELDNCGNKFTSSPQPHPTLDEATASLLTFCQINPPC